MLTRKTISGFIGERNNFMYVRLFATQVFHKELHVNSVAQSTEWDLALPYKEIPGPSKFENLRNFLPGGKFYKKSRYDITKMLYKEYGEMVKIPGIFKQKDIVFVSNPNYFEKVYRNDGIWPARKSLDTLTYYRHKLKPEIFTETGTLVTSNGEEWAKFRSKVNPVMMQPKTVKIYISRMDKTTNKFIDRVRKIRDPYTNELPNDFESELNAWALEQICLVGLDTELGVIGNIDMNSDAQKLISAVSTIFAKVDKIEFRPSIWKYFATPIYKEIMKAYDTLTNISLKYIEEAIERYKLNAKDDSRNENEKSVVERLIKIDKNVAVIMAMEMFFAGVDTTTTTFTGCFLALAKNPEKQKILREEIRKVFPNRDSPLTEEKLKNLPYLRAVIKESIRKYPIVHDFARTTNVNFVLGKYQIPKNTDIIMHGTHSYNKNQHFSDADKFLPERWLRNQNENKIEGSENGSAECPVTATKSSNPFVYLPFGFGTRMCIGKRIVDMELEIVLTRMLQNFHVEYNYDDKDMFELKLINTPAKELKFKLTDISY